MSGLAYDIPENETSLGESSTHVYLNDHPIWTPGTSAHDAGRPEDDFFQPPRMSLNYVRHALLTSLCSRSHLHTPSQSLRSFFVFERTPRI